MQNKHQVSYLLLRCPQPVSAALALATYSAGIEKSFVRVMPYATYSVSPLSASSHTQAYPQASVQHGLLK